MNKTDSAMFEADDDDVISIPAGDIINQTMPLQVVAQQESTRSYFLAQTLESTRTVPIVSASLPLDTATADEANEASENEGDSGGAVDDGSEDSDESDLRSALIATESTVVGSFEYRGITYAVEPGGESVAIVAADSKKLPEDFTNVQTILLSSKVISDISDYYDVTRIADYAFAAMGSSDEDEGIISISIPASVVSIGEDAFTDFDTLEYVIVSEDNPVYSQYDGCLYDADQTCLLLIPEGRLGAVRIAPSVTSIDPEVFSHCPSVDSLVADADSAAYQLLSENDSITIPVSSPTEEEVASWDNIEAVSQAGGNPFEMSSRATYGATTYTASAYSYVANTFLYRTLNHATGADGHVSKVGAANAYSLGAKQTATTGPRIIKRANGSYILQYDASSTITHDIKNWSSTELGKYINNVLYWDSTRTNAVAAGTHTKNLDGFLGWGWTKYTVSYNANGGTGSQASVGNLEITHSVTLPAEENCGIKRTGHTLHRWKIGDTYFTPGDEVGIRTLALAADCAPQMMTDTLTLVPVWRANPYTISFDSRGGVGGQEDDVIATYDAAMPPISGVKPVREGFTFAGWYDVDADEGGTQYYTAAGESTRAWNKTEDTTLYARWNKLGSFTVNLLDTRLDSGDKSVWYWIGQGYVATRDSTTVVQIGEKIVDVPDMLPDYKFAGYFDSEGAAARKMINADGQLLVDDVLSESATWYARWEQLACPVVLAASYGIPAFAVEEKGTETIEKHAVFNAPFWDSVTGGKIAKLPRRIGYKFLGYWSQENPSLTSETSEHDYAGTRWIDAYGTLSDEAWTVYPEKDKNAVTLYAAWMLKDQPVSFSTATPDGTEKVVVRDASALESFVLRYGEPLPVAFPTPSESTFVRNGYSFDGWYYEETDESGKMVKRFISNEDGTRAFEKWDRDLVSVELKAEWKANEYLLMLDEAYPTVEGESATESPSHEVTIAYDAPFTVNDPEYAPYSFAGWYLKNQSDVSLTAIHTTDGRFTPRGDLASQISPAKIEVKAAWNAPSDSNYHLYAWTPGSENPNIIVTTKAYSYEKPVTLGKASYPAQVAGWKPAGWVEVKVAEGEDGDELAHALIADGGPAKDAPITSSFGPRSNAERFFVFKWTTVPFSLSFKTEPDKEGDESYVKDTDILKNASANGENTPLSWSEACKVTNTGNPAHATYLAYDVVTDAFALPVVSRKGYDFVGWEQLSPEDPLVGEVLDPKAVAESAALHELMLAPVFRESTYKIVLEPGTEGREAKTFFVNYNETFAFPYPDVLNTGACFAYWEALDGTSFAPLREVPVAEQQDGSFCLSDLDTDGDKVITLSAIWYSAYNVSVPIRVTTMAIDTETGDMMAAGNALRPSLDGETYEVISLRAEPVLDNNDYAPFSGASAGHVYLSVYAGMTDPVDETSLLKKENVGTKGVLTYIDKKSNAPRTANPLLVKLGDSSVSFVNKTKDGDENSLSSRYGFTTFTRSSPLTIRYGLVFDGVDPKVFDYRADADTWTLPEKDHANTQTTENRRIGWSSESKALVKLCYTVRLLESE